METPWRFRELPRGVSCAERDREAGAAAGAGSGVDLTAVGADELGDDREPDTAPGRAGRGAPAPEPLEQVRQLVLRDPGSGVLDDQPGGAVL